MTPDDGAALDFDALARLADELRVDVLKMLNLAGSGHTGGSLGMADVYTVLWFGGHLRVDPERPDAPDRDRFVLSNGHEVIGFSFGRVTPAPPMTGVLLRSWRRLLIPGIVLPLRHPVAPRDQGRLEDLEGVRMITYPEISFEERMSTVEFRVSHAAHIVLNADSCRGCSTQDCVTACPAGLFVRTSDGGIVFNYEQCFECGTCYLICDTEGALSWSYPDGGHGVVFARG